MTDSLDYLDLRTYTPEEREVFYWHLEEIQIKILEMRFGIKTGIPQTLSETGHRLGLTRIEVRRAEARAMQTILRLINLGVVER